MTPNRGRGPRRSQKSPKRGLRIGALTVALGVLAVAAVGAIGGATPFTIAGFTAKVSNGTNTVATAPYFKCSDAEAADKSSAAFQYYLNETSASTVARDSDGNAANGTYQGSMTTSTTKPIACSRDTGGAYVLDGSTSYVSTPTLLAGPATFSIEVWFKTTVAGGELIGFGDKQTGLSRNKDRVLYIAATGQVVFATYNGANQALSDPGNYADGKWHHVVGTMSPQAGMSLYIDGKLSISYPFTTAQSFNGYWRVGYDNLNGWPSVASNYFFTGSMRYAAAYSTALTAQQVSNHYAAGQ